eukprot:2772648-Amphidinium_carterae.1
MDLCTLALQHCATSCPPWLEMILAADLAKDDIEVGAANPDMSEDTVRSFVLKLGQNIAQNLKRQANLLLFVTNKPYVGAYEAVQTCLELEALVTSLVTVRYCSARVSVSKAIVADQSRKGAGGAWRAFVHERCR